MHNMTKSIPPKSIWKIPKYLPYIQPPLTNEIVEEAEKKMGYKFPKEYIELLKIQNGGFIRYTIEETPHSVIAGIGPYFPSITDFDWFKDYEDAMSFKLEGLFPFDGDGHWNICLDYRNNKTEPEITYVDTESDYQNPIAKNFAEYLSLLKLDADGEYVIETDSSIEDIAKQISKIADIKFEEPDYFGQGYPIFRSKYNGSWVWLSPNKARGGFVREGHERYEELKSQMETAALRFPEIYENSLFINISDEKQRQNLIELLTKNGMNIYELKNLV
jgi:hypothetical protein